MPQFKTHRRVRHAAREMFDLVADVERYPEFVPLCTGMRVRSRTFGLLAGTVFDQVFRRMAAAFEARADRIYGRPTA